MKNKKEIKRKSEFLAQIRIRISLKAWEEGVICLD